MVRCKFRVIPTCIIVLVLAAGLCAQDPGVLDTVRLGSDSATVWQKASISVFLFNDEAVSSITIPLLIDGYSGWATFDSVSYVGGRLASAAIMNVRQVQVVESDTFSVQKLIIRFEVGSGTNLPAGSGKLCELWFKSRFGGTVRVDSATVSGTTGLSLIEVSAGVFVPQFQAGDIQIACDYIIGDIDVNDILTISDLLGIQKEIYWHLGFTYGSPYAAADLNCDRHVDMRDVNYLADYIFASGPAPCVCGNYTPAHYNDPGARDTMSVSSQTIMVGFSTRLQFNLSNDEPIRSFAFSLEWDGTASLGRTGNSSSWDSLTARIINRNAPIGDGYGYGMEENGVSPDTFHISNLSLGPIVVIEPGTGAIFCPKFVPLTPGTLTFRLLPYRTGAESMITDVNGNTILPEFVSGVITVVPRPCGDADKNGLVTISDAVYLINYIFSGGPAPCAGCP